MQTVQALKHILQTGHKPSNVRDTLHTHTILVSNVRQVIIGGDSAGGNLALGIISASLHSHAGIPDLKLESHLRGALLISPWTSFSADGNSYTENIDKDIVTKEIMVGLRDDFVSSMDKDEFAEPAQADSAWWANAPVDSILNLGGAYEIFWDYIRDLGVKMKEAKLNVETVECEKQVHIDCVLDAQAGFEPGPMSLAIWEWLRKIL